MKKLEFIHLSEVFKMACPDFETTRTMLDSCISDGYTKLYVSLYQLTFIQDIKEYNHKNAINLNDTYLAGTYKTLEIYVNPNVPFFCKECYVE